MKKYIILMSAALLAMSCATELADPNQEATGDIKYKTITFDVVSDNTKTTIEEATDPDGDKVGVVKWEKGDKISIYYWDGEQQVEVAATADGAGTSTTFTAEINEEHNPEYYYATYPAGKGTLTVTDGKPSFTINVNAAGCDGSFKQANFAAAYTTGRTFQFHNAVGIMKIAIPETILGRDNTEYPVTGIYVRCKANSTDLNGEISFDPDGVEDMFGVASKDASGAANISMQKLSKDVIASGYVYVPCTPATWPDGLCFRYYSSAGTVPAVLTKDTEVNIQRGHVFPVPDFSSKVVWDYYVSSDASEDGTGLSAEDPMTLSKLQSEYLAPVSKQYGSMRMNGTAINFAPGKYNLTAPLAFPQGATSSVTYSIVVNGNGAVLDGGTVSSGSGDTRATVTTKGKQVMTVGQYSHIVVNDLVIQNGYAVKGAGVALNYIAGTTDDNTTIAFNNCKFLRNISSSTGGGVFIEEAASGGILSFNDCYFKDNQIVNTTAYEGGFLYTKCGKTAVMFNKCTFHKNKAGKGGMEIHMNDAGCRLAMNNCTINGFNAKAQLSQGSAITCKGYSLIANSTIWNSGYNGAWGSVSLGCGKANNQVNGHIVLNSVVRNATTQEAFRVSESYYQNYKHCIYTGLVKNDKNVTLGTHYFIDNCYDLGVGGAVAGASGDDKTTASRPYMAYKWTWVDGYPCPTLKQVRDAIFNTAEIGPMFLRWLDTIEGSLTTDIAGQPRNENAMCPGSYQQATTPDESASANLRTPVKVMSFNILREDLSLKWTARKEAVLQMLTNQYPDIIGLQECSWTIRKNILEADPRRKAIGNSVNDEESGYTRTSSNSIIYRGDLYEVVTSGQFWFSDTPDEVSDVFNAPTPFEPKSRTCVWARFRSKLSGQEFYHFNIHLHNGSAYNKKDKYIGDSRTKSLELLFERIALYNTENLPVIITGDHNESDISASILDPSDVAEAYEGSGYTSARRIAPETDTDRTVNSFDEEATAVLDHIYVNSGCEVNRFSVDRAAYAGVTYISDHYPVICDLILAAPSNSADIEDYDYKKVNW